MNPWGVESEWDRAGPPIGKRGRGGWWVNSSARAQAAGRGVYLKKLDFILTELNAFCCNSSFRVHRAAFFFYFGEW